MTTVRNAIQFLRRVFGRKPATREQDYALFFVIRLRKFVSPCCRMLLKADLAKNGKSLEEVERMRHNLKRLWRAYKRDHPNAALSRHDTTINKLDKHEDIRYPNPALGSTGVSMKWSGEPGWGEGVWRDEITQTICRGRE